MLNNVSKLRGFAVAAIDGEAGTVKDVYFDDDKWVIRYLVIETGGWFSGRKVLLSPFSILGADWSNGRIRLNLTKEQIRSSPDVDMDKPVSRQHESDLLNHYGYPYYWAGPLTWGYVPYPTMLADSTSAAADGREAHAMQEARDKSDPHLRSCREVAGYGIRTTDDEIGHVEDFLFDDENWSIQLIVVNPRNWWPRKHVMISPQRIDRIEWADRQVVVTLTRDEVEHSPEFDFVDEPSLEKRQGLYRHFSGPPS